MLSKHWPISGHTHKRPPALVRSAMAAAFALSLPMAGLAMAAPAAAALPPPSNDDFASATLLVGASGSIAGDNTDATAQSGEPAPITDDPDLNLSDGNASVWYDWTAPTTASTTFDTCGDTDTDVDTVLGVYTGSSVDALTTIGENDDGDSCGLFSSVTFDAVAGTTYRILVGGFDNEYLQFQLKWSQVVPGADLAIGIEDSSDVVEVGEELTYSISVTNGGPEAAASVVVTDTLPSGVTYVSASASQGTCTMSAGIVTCELGNVAANAEPSPTVTIVVRPTVVNDKLVNEASVTSESVEPTPLDNTAFVVTRVTPQPGSCTIVGTSGPDDLRGTADADVICGLGGNDTLRGGAGDDTVKGNAGDDTLVGGPGSDTLNGAKGNDAVSYRGATSSVRVNLAEDTATDGSGDIDTLISVGGGGVYGSNFADLLRGSDQRNHLFGGPSADVLSGLDGNDLLVGAGGDDRLRGGTGTDTCSGEVETGCERD